MNKKIAQEIPDTTREVKKNRVVFLDYLRVFATIAVIVLHVSGQNWYTLNVKTLNWNILNFYDSIVRWCVPVFIMISGSLFLKKDKKNNIKKLYKKNILRMTISFFAWSIVYIVLSIALSTNEDISIIQSFTQGEYHMWFIPMLIGIYICIPIIEFIIQSKRVTNYFLAISFVFSFIIPQALDLISDFIGGAISDIAYNANTFISRFSLNFIGKYSFYFVLGYILFNYQISNKQKKYIYVLGAFGFLTTVSLTSLSSIINNTACENYYNNFSINVLLESVLIFVSFKHIKFNSEKMNIIISKLSKYSFGAYLSHVIFIDVLQHFGIDNLMFSPIICIPIISIVVALCSFFVSFVINKIPFVNKYIV